tara:strand:+ start:1498 stop:1842 length:345 start_codon:yes stop_codon:yes gene_type:complete
MRIKTERYMSTYSFVSANNLEKIADLKFGKDWEAEDDVNQIQELCDLIAPDKYVVNSINGLKYEDDIEVREMDDFMSTGLYEWMNLFVDFVQEHDRNIYNSACEYADKIQKDLL